VLFSSCICLNPLFRLRYLWNGPSRCIMGEATALWLLHSSQPAVSPPVPMKWSLQVHYGTSHCSFPFCIRLNLLFRHQSTVISQVDTLLLRYRRMDTENMHLSILVTTLSSQGLSNQVLAINMCLRKQTCCFSKYLSNRTEETCERDAD
jgi:hypothetical protein